MRNVATRFLDFDFGRLPVVVLGCPKGRDPTY